MAGVCGYRKGCSGWFEEVWLMRQQEEGLFECPLHWLTAALVVACMA